MVDVTSSALSLVKEAIELAQLLRGKYENAKKIKPKLIALNERLERISELLARPLPSASAIEKALVQFLEKTIESLKAMSGQVSKKGLKNRFNQIFFADNFLRTLDEYNVKLGELLEDLSHQNTSKIEEHTSALQGIADTLHDLANHTSKLIRSANACVWWTQHFGEAPVVATTEFNQKLKAAVSAAIDKKGEPLFPSSLLEKDFTRVSNVLVRLMDEDCDGFISAVEYDKVCGPSDIIVNKFSELWVARSKLGHLQVLSPPSQRPTYAARSSCKTLDICFVVDITNSMADQLDSVRNGITSVLSTFKDRFTSIRVAFSFFSDVVNSNPADPQNRFSHVITFDFGQPEQILPATQVIRPVVFSGDDIPEDVVGGLFMATCFQWLSDLKIIILLTDSPTHGQEFHEFPASWDRFATTAMPHGMQPSDVLGYLGYLEADFWFFRLNKSTDKMVAAFNKYYIAGSIREDAAIHTIKLSAAIPFKSALEEAIRKSIAREDQDKQKEAILNSIVRDGKDNSE